MTSDQRSQAITKLAFYGNASVNGCPNYFMPQPTVGQMMADLNSLQTITPFERRRALDQIVSTGVDVNSPIKSLISAGIGAIAGKAITKALGFSPFAQGVAATLGGQYGYKL